MNRQDAQERLKALHTADGAWLSPRHVGTSVLRHGVAARLSRDPHVEDIEFVEIWLDTDMPNIDSFEGIFEVDDRGIWFYDGDGSVDEPVWRQQLIPWRHVLSVMLHQSS